MWGNSLNLNPETDSGAPMSAVSGEVLCVPVSAPNCGVLCNANEKQKIANRQLYGDPSNSIFPNGFRNGEKTKTRRKPISKIYLLAFQYVFLLLLCLHFFCSFRN